MIENFVSEILSGNLTRLKAEKIAKQNGLTDIVKVKELVEYACLLAYRSITSNQNLNFQQKFDEIKKIYQTQPNLSVRSTRSMELAQYSTAAPIAFLAGAYVAAKLPPDFRILEPSAGNGMMSIFWGHNTQNIWVNEIDPNRIENLRK
ncbi:MAG: hypothetical protein PHQ62_04240, partial [Clostridia bacterium]|nr:hypothetical protein [Clostridia bacterium]